MLATFDTILLWLLQGGVSLRVLYSYCYRSIVHTVAADYPKRYETYLAHQEEFGCVAVDPIN